MRLTKYKTILTAEKRVSLDKEFSINCPDVDRIIRSPGDVSKLAKSVLRLHEEPEEYLYMVCLNVKNMIIGVFELTHGTVNSSVVGVREIFQKALLANAVSIIVMHNHPSGDPTPSREDIEVTKRMIEAGRIVGVEVLDHIIIGDTYCSLKERGNI